LSEVLEHGYASIGFEGSTLDLAGELGLRPRRTDRLAAREAAPEPRLSLSREFGLGAFPWHTDDAHTLVPARLMLLRTLTVSRTPTLVLDTRAVFSGDERLVEVMRTGTWLVRGELGLFYSAVLGPSDRWRVNPLVMQATGKRAVAADVELRNRVAQSGTVRHEWAEQSRILVVDNARMLHARPAVRDESRVLERTLCDAPGGLGL
jgi:L-asparagine oxygenase